MRSLCPLGPGLPLLDAARRCGRAGQGDPLGDHAIEEDAPRVRWWRCAACAGAIAEEGSRIALPGGAAVQVHANPHGLFFAVLAFATAHNLSLIGAPSLDFTWYPGYAWQIALCLACHQHLGWFFTPTDSLSQQASFYALRQDRVAAP